MGHMEQGEGHADPHVGLELEARQVHSLRKFVRVLNQVWRVSRQLETQRKCECYRELGLLEQASGKEHPPWGSSPRPES